MRSECKKITEWLENDIKACTFWEFRQLHGADNGLNSNVWLITIKLYVRLWTKYRNWNILANVGH